MWDFDGNKRLEVGCVLASCSAELLRCHQRLSLVFCGQPSGGQAEGVGETHMKDLLDLGGSPPPIIGEAEHTFLRAEKCINKDFKETHKHGLK